MSTTTSNQPNIHDLQQAARDLSIAIAIATGLNSEELREPIDAFGRTPATLFFSLDLVLG